MPKFEVDVPHALTPDEARARIARATPKLENEYGATCTWKGERELVVSRKGLDAHLAIEPSRIHVDLNLGFLLTPLANAIKNGIAKELSGILGATNPAAS